MKKSLLSSMLCGVMLMSTTAFADNTLKIGVEGAYPPFSTTNSDGEITGFDIDIANALCAEMNRECVMVGQDWDGMIPALLAKKFDAIIASMSVTEERLKQVDFTDKYYAASTHLLRKKGSGIEFDALDGLSVGAQQGTVMDVAVTDRFGDVLSVERYPTQEDANLDAESGRLDLLVMEDAIAIEFLGTDAGADWEIFGDALTDPDPIAVAIRKEDQELKENINAAIQAIRANGKYAELAKAYFGDFDIYGK